MRHFPSYQSQGEPIKERRSEFEGRSPALEELAGALQLAKKSLDQIKSPNPKDDKYSHLTEEEVKKVEKAVQEKWTWLEEKRILLAGTVRTQQPPVTVAQIRAEKQVSVDFPLKSRLLERNSYFLTVHIRIFIAPGIGQRGTTYCQQA